VAEVGQDGKSWGLVTSVSERLAERFHMDEDFLMKSLNPARVLRQVKTLAWPM